VGEEHHDLGHRIAKAKDDVAAKEMLESMKARLPDLAEKARAAESVPDEQWSEFKSAVDLALENLGWMQGAVMRRLAAS